MNVASIFRDVLNEGANKDALVFGGCHRYTFSDMAALISKYQKLFIREGVKNGDKIVFMIGLNADLYAAIIAAMGLGAGVLMIEPWMPSKKIEQVITREKPSFYVHSFLGRIIGLKNSSLRQIPAWISTSKASFELSGDIRYEEVSKDHTGMVAYTSGTTGTPKGVNRTHGILADQVDVFRKYLVTKKDMDELTMFPSFVLGNMASFKTSVVVPPNWNSSVIKKINRNCKNVGALTTAPAFLKKILDEKLFPSLKEVHLGGALCDVSLAKKAIERGIEVTHVYGSSEAEPVTLCPAEKSILKAKEKGHFQLTYLGEKVPEIELKLEQDNTWVTGGHVSKLYLNDEKSNLLNKKKDQNGTVWHSMGDRLIDEGGLWFKGRSNQSLESFEAEQKICEMLQNSCLFIDERAEGNILIVDKSLKKREAEIKSIVKAFGLANAEIRKITRDKRHRSRIDRNVRTKKYEGKK